MHCARKKKAKKNVDKHGAHQTQSFASRERFRRRHVEQNANAFFGVDALAVVRGGEEKITDDLRQRLAFVGVQHGQDIDGECHRWGGGG